MGRRLQEENRCRSQTPKKQFIYIPGSTVYPANNVPDHTHRHGNHTGATRRWMPGALPCVSSAGMEKR